MTITDSDTWLQLDFMKLKRFFLMGLIASVLLASLMGIYALLARKSLDEFEWKIIGSTSSVGLFSLTSLMAAIVHERGVWRPMMVIDFIISGLGLVTYLLAIWLLFDLVRYEYEEYIGKLMGIQAVWAIAIAHAGLLALTRSDIAYVRWPRLITIVFVFCLAGFITLTILVEPRYSEELYFRIIGILSIIVVAGTITTPVMQKVAGLNQAASVQSTRLEVQIRCPRCMTTQTMSTGHSRCVQCRLKFQIDIQEPRCPQCDYVLYRLTKPVCPECGCALGPEEMPASSGQLGSDNSA